MYHVVMTCDDVRQDIELKVVELLKRIVEDGRMTEMQTLADRPAGKPCLGWNRQGLEKKQSYA